MLLRVEDKAQDYRVFSIFHANFGSITYAQALVTELYSKPLFCCQNLV